MERGQPDFPALWQLLEPMLQNSILVAHNAPFDLRVLASCLRTLCTQFIRSRMLNRLVAIDGVLTTLSLLLYYLLFLSVFKMGATGFLLANALADLTSMVFVFIAGGCWRDFKPKAFNMALWKDMLRYCLPMIPASISFWIINASDMFFVQALCEGYGGRRSSRSWAASSTRHGSSPP